jgi:HAE1 family hydrophobic/amphiphilic exporter-1
VRLSHFFIDRPVFAVVVSVLITLLGAIAYPTLPVAQYPEIIPPTVTISATYPGASAETLADTVADPIEEQVNGVEDMLYMSSQSTADGHVTITCTFALGTDPDKAQVLVENRVATATPRLPDVVRNIGVTVRKATPDILMAVHMYSPDGSLDQQYVSNYVNLHVRNELLRLKGVGDIASRATRDYAMRIWIDPDKAAARGMTVDDVVSALRAHNVQVAAGNLGAPPFGSGKPAEQLNIQTLGRLSTPEQFGAIIIKVDPQGRMTRVSDVARVDLGAADYTTNAYMNGSPAVALAILQLPGSNGLQTAQNVLSTMKRLSADFPPGLSYRIIYNPTEYVRASIVEVQKTLFEALALVVLVVLVFLQSWRAALIPILAIPVSLIGTFAVMKLFGFSLNNLSLFGLVLAIGIVVDDAIVVVENIERHLDAGMPPRDAAHVTMDEVGGALLAIALVLTAVFIPAAMITGISGQFYRQFALTIAAATVISLVVSLTLSPALAGLILRPHKRRAAHATRPWWKRPLAAFGEWFNAGFDRLSHGYSRVIHKLVRLVAIVLVVYAALLALTTWRLFATPTGFIPSQDQGYFLLSAQLPPGSSLARTDQVMRELIPIVLKAPGVLAVSVYAGVDATTQVTASNAGQMYIVLSPFAERDKRGLSAAGILADLRKRVADYTRADVRLIPPPPVRGIGVAGGFKMIIENQRGTDYAALEKAAHQVAEAATKEHVATNVFVTFNTKTPRVFADIDRDKAEVLGVPATNVFDTLETYLGSTYVNDFNLFGRTYQVYAQASPGYRTDAAAITDLQTRAASGGMTPLGSVVTLGRQTGPYRVLRYNIYPSAEIQGESVPGASSGETLAAMERIAEKTLPRGFSFEWTELAYQQKLAGATATIAFALAVVFVFLLLAALYESVTLPFSVVLIVPMCLLAALTGVSLRHADNNVLTQIGLIVLIGLAAKNAILIVEFARQGEIEHGHERRSAAEEAGRTRLRPILMTSFAFILGVAPLVVAKGAGAELRQALGVAVFFGMIGVTLFGLIFTPVFYVVCRAISDRLPKPPPTPSPTPTTSQPGPGAEPEPPPAEAPG